jgi:ankyrin repeat protein
MSKLLFDLIKKHQISEVIKILEEDKELDINLRDNSDNYLIQYAIIGNEIELLKTLLKRDVKLDIIDGDGRTLLYLPIKYNYMESLTLILDNNDKLLGITLTDITDINGNIPLHYAIMFGNKEAINLLIKYNSNINLQDKNGDNSLQIAIKYKQVETCKLLLDLNININARSISGETSLHYACNYELFNIVKLLLEHYADPNVSDLNNQFIPLMYATIINNQKIVEILLKYKADPTLQDINGDTSLHHAVNEGNTNFIKLYIPYFQNMNYININGYTIAHDILYKFKSDIKKLDEMKFDLILEKTNVNIQDNDGNSVLFLLTKYKLWMRYRSILEHHNNNIYIKNKENIRPIDNILENDKKVFYEFIVNSYLNILRERNMKWKNKWEQLCVKKMDENTFATKFKELGKFVNVTNKDDVCLDIIKYFVIQKEQSIPISQITYSINIPVLKNTSFVTYTGSTLDIIFGLIGLYYKYNKEGNKYICSTLTPNFINNPEIDEYFDSLGIIKSYKIEYLNFEIIWTYQKLFIPTFFNEIVAKYEAHPKIQYMIIPLGIELSQGSHGNIIIIGFTKKEIERFEPNGANYPFGFNYNPELLDDILIKLFDKLLPTYKYFKPKDFLPKIGFQQLELSEHYKTRKIGDPGGFCSAWSIWYSDMRIKYNDISREKLVKELINKIKGENISFKHMIRDYTKNITDIRDKYLKKVGLDINNWLNDDFDDTQLDKFNVILTELIEKHVLLN